MTATDELRRLLDERGVEWTYGDDTVSYASDGRWFHAWAYNDDTMCVSMGYLTPAQAVEATLGRGTCHDTGEDKERFCCSECGSRSHIATEYRKFDEYGNKSEHFLFVGNPRFYPSCGRRVVG